MAEATKKGKSDQTRTSVTQTPTSRRTQELEAAGVRPPAKTPSAQTKRLKETAEAQIDEFIRKIGGDPRDQTTEDGARMFALGSARGTAQVIETGNVLLLNVEVVIMRLPADKELLLPLMRELMVLNAEIHQTGPTKFGIRGQWITLTNCHPLWDLRPGEIEGTVTTAMVLADTFDDILQGKYPGTTRQRTPRK